MRLLFFMLAPALLALALPACHQEAAQPQIPKVSSRDEAIQVLKEQFPTGWRIHPSAYASDHVHGLSLTYDKLVENHDRVPGVHTGPTPRKNVFEIFLTFVEPGYRWKSFPDTPESLVPHNRRYTHEILKNFNDTRARVLDEPHWLNIESYKKASYLLSHYSHPAFRTANGGSVWISVQYLPTDRCDPSVIQDLARMRSVVRAMLNRVPGYQWEWPLPLPPPPPTASAPEVAHAHVAGRE